MTLARNIFSALASLRGSLLRSALTILGIVIGVGSVVLLVAIGQGVRQEVTRQIDELGANLLMVLPGRMRPDGRPNPMAMAGISTLSDADVAAIRAIPGVAECVPVVLVAGSAERAANSFLGAVIAAPGSIAGVRRARLASGRFYTAADDSQRVCVLSAGPARDLFGTATAVGQAIGVRGVEFRVVGVLAEDADQGLAPGPTNAMRDVVYLPFASARAAFGGAVSRILVTTDYRHPPEAMITAVRSRMLALRGGREDFGIMTQRQLLAAIYNVLNILTALLAGIAAISLVVAAIGIMNIMLVTVTERTREIGIRMAVGARRRDIFAQFVTEAIVMSFTGGLMGIGLALGVGWGVQRFSPLKPVVTPGAVMLAFGVCFVVGLAAGVAPAMRAARCSPIDALRYE